jgi:hypothetical protein
MLPDEQGFVVEELSVSEVLLEYPGDLLEVLAVRMRDRCGKYTS